MKKTTVAIMVIAFVTLWTSMSSAGQLERRGMFIGAGSGAVIGHAVGRTPEAALIGSAIGGAIGATVAHAQRHGVPLPQPIIVPPPFPPHPKFINNPPPRHRINPEPRCRISERTVYKHGQQYTITKKICRQDRRDDRPWNHHHRNDWDRNRFERF